MIWVKRLIEADGLVNPHLRKGKHILANPMRLHPWQGITILDNGFLSRDQ